MAETTKKIETKTVAPKGDAVKASANDGGSGQKRNDRRGGGRNDRRRSKRRRPEREPREFEQRILDLARVTRVTTGGKRMRFRCALVIGDQKGRVGFGVAKGTDVQMAIQKAFHQAKRNVMTLDLVNGTFPHRQSGKFGAADVLIMPAPKGTGLKSGGAIRMILDLAGVSDAVTKILGSKNKVNVAKATFAALNAMMVPEGIETDGAKLLKERKSKRANAGKKVVKSGDKKVAKKAPVKQPDSKKTPVKKVEEKKAPVKKSPEKETVKKEEK